jgi:hypothetical protein
MGLLIVGSAEGACKTSKPKPDRSLTISTEVTTVKAQKEMAILVTVEEKNTSHHKIYFLFPDPDRYKISVLLDGRPAPTTEMYREILNPRALPPNVLPTWSGGWNWIKPGKSEISAVPLSMYFDLSAPGKYEITFVEETNRGQPNSVEIKSNTIHIIVLSADAPAPRQ